MSEIEDLRLLPSSLQPLQGADNSSLEIADRNAISVLGKRYQLMKGCQIRMRIAAIRVAGDRHRECITTLLSQDVQDFYRG